MTPYETMSREELLQALKAFAKNWLAHDGCLVVRKRLGVEASQVGDSHRSLRPDVRCSCRARFTSQNGGAASRAVPWPGNTARTPPSGTAPTCPV